MCPSPHYVTCACGRRWWLLCGETHNGQRWIATVGNNHWEPGVYGWEPVAD